ncbi:hypothetical protein J6590_030141 [Homalodisca vitripennis]|nr:hypothetical protein J6590_030141 [Homalodisca vitripennis]
MKIGVQNERFHVEIPKSARGIGGEGELTQRLSSRLLLGGTPHDHSVCEGNIAASFENIWTRGSEPTHSLRFFFWKHVKTNIIEKLWTPSRSLAHSKFVLTQTDSNLPFPRIALKTHGFQWIRKIIKIRKQALTQTARTSTAALGTHCQSERESRYRLAASHQAANCATASA